MENIQDLEKSFTELQEYSDTQFRTIIDLKKQIESLREENKNLRASIPNSEIVSVSDLSGLGISNEQLICETQIALFKERAVMRELSLEEAKKLQIYTTILSDIRKAKEETPDLNVQKLSDDELLQLVVNNEPSNASSNSSET